MPNPHLAHGGESRRPAPHWVRGAQALLAASQLGLAAAGAETTSPLTDTSVNGSERAAAATGKPRLLASTFRPTRIYTDTDQALAHAAKFEGRPPVSRTLPDIDGYVSFYFQNPDRDKTGIALTVPPGAVEDTAAKIEKAGYQIGELVMEDNRPAELTIGTGAALGFGASLGTVAALGLGALWAVRRWEQGRMRKELAPPPFDPQTLIMEPRPGSLGDIGGCPVAVDKLRQLAAVVHRVNQGQAGAQLPRVITVLGEEGSGKSTAALGFINETKAPTISWRDSLDRIPEELRGLPPGVLLPYYFSWARALKAGYTRALGGDPESGKGPQAVIFLAIDACEYVLQDAAMRDALRAEIEPTSRHRNDGIVLLLTARSANDLGFEPANAGDVVTMTPFADAAQALAGLENAWKRKSRETGAAVTLHPDAHLEEFASVIVGGNGGEATRLMNYAVRQALSNGGRVTQAHLVDALQEVFVGPRNPTLHGDLSLRIPHEVIGHILPARAVGLKPAFFSIVPRGNELARAHLPLRQFMSEALTLRELLLASLMFAGGRAAERVVLGEMPASRQLVTDDREARLRAAQVTTAASNDFDRIERYLLTIYTNHLLPGYGDMVTLGGDPEKHMRATLLDWKKRTLDAMHGILWTRIGTARAIEISEAFRQAVQTREALVGKELTDFTDGVVRADELTAVGEGMLDFVAAGFQTPKAESVSRMAL